VSPVIAAACARVWTVPRRDASPESSRDPAPRTDPRPDADITDPQLAADSTEAALDAEPMLNADVTEPIEPIDRKLPTEAMLSTDPRLAIDSTLSWDAIDHLDATTPPCHVATLSPDGVAEARLAIAVAAGRAGPRVALTPARGAVLSL